MDTISNKIFLSLVSCFYFYKKEASFIEILKY